ncbi:MAG: tyrosine-type recombinase/integrase [Planctomycetes bacterium]|nr:tyrosine-type recombinase/integrase [Planctomycetota bacterium]
MGTISGTIFGTTVSSDDTRSPKARRKQRQRTDHPGVKVRRRRNPSGALVHRAHYLDPSTGMEVAVTLERLGLASREARRAWCLAKSETLARERAALASGSPAAARTTLADAVKQYLDGVAVELRPGTLAAYRQSAFRFAAWAEEAGIRRPANVTIAGLAKFRQAAVAAPRAAVVKGGPRGARKPTLARRRRPSSINRDFRAVGTMLNTWRRAGLVPYLTSDSIRDAFRRAKETYPLPAFIPTADLRRILEAALRHDRAVFKMTRAEKVGGGALGETPRYRPAAPFIGALLLTGGRYGEIATLKWSDVDQGGALGPGNIRIGVESKTGRARLIPFDVSPALRRLLAAMRLRSPESIHVFAGAGDDSPFSKDLGKATLRRLIDKYGAAPFTWHQLRKSNATYCVCAAGLGGAAGVWLAAKRLGNSPIVLERHYAGLVSVPPDKTTIEAAMGVEDLIETIIARVAAGGATPAAAPAAEGGGS